MRTIEKIIRKNWLVYYIFRKIYAIFFVNFFFEPECGAFDYLLKKKKLVIVDIGSSDGSFSKNISKKIDFSNFICFEPLFFFHKKFNLYNNNVLKLYSCACGSKKKTETFYTPYKKILSIKIYLKFWSSSKIKFIYYNVNKYFGKNNKFFQYERNLIQVRTLDTFKLKPNIIKVDVENSETEVLLGSINTVKKYYPIMLIEHPSKSIDRVLKKIGYEKYQYNLGKKKLIKITTNNNLSYNYFFIHKKNNFFNKNVFKND